MFPYIPLGDWLLLDSWRVMITVGILGVGRIGRLHADNLLSMPHVRLKSVADPMLDPQEWKRRGIEASLDTAAVLGDDEIVHGLESFRTQFSAGPVELG